MNPESETRSRPGSRLCLSVAGLAVDLRLEDSGLEQAVRNRYRLFLHDGSADFSVFLQSSPHGRHTPLMDTGVRYNRTQLDFIDGSGEVLGTIDFASRCAYISSFGKNLFEDLEYCLRVVYAYLLFDIGGLLFHAAGIERDGEAFLFFGKSGIGKTTVSRVSTSCTVLNDDLVAILPDQGSWRVHGTPFWNPSQVSPGRACAPLRGLYCLVQDKLVYMETLSPALALGEIIANVPVLSADPIRSIDLVERCNSLVETVAVYNLHFLPDDSFWPVVLAGQHIPNPGSSHPSSDGY